MLYDAEKLKIDHLAIRGNDSFTYGIMLYNSFQVEITHSVFSATGGVVLSNVTTILLKACQFKENIIVSKNCTLSKPLSPLLVTDMDLERMTQVTISSSSFMRNVAQISNCSQGNAVGGLAIILPYQAHPPCNINLGNNNFIHNLVTGKIGVGAFQLTVSSNEFISSCVLVSLTNNIFRQNKVKGSQTGSGSVNLFVQGCSDLTLTSMANKYNCNVGEGNIPGAVEVYLQSNNCQANSTIHMLLSNDTFVGNVGLQRGGAVNMYFSALAPSGSCKSSIFEVCLHFFQCSFYNNTASYGSAMDIYSNVQNFQCYNDNHLSLILEECTFSMNRIVSELSVPLDQTANLVYSAIVETAQMCVGIINSTFFDNKGTALVLDNVCASFSGVIIIDNNTGVNGGGIRWDTSFYVDIKPGTQINITNNNAVEGGAVYFNHMQGDCHLTCNGGRSSLAQCEVRIVVLNNTGSSSGHITFMVNPLSHKRKHKHLMYKE